MNNYCSNCTGAILPNGSMGYAGLVCHCPYKVTVGCGGSGSGEGGGGLSGIDYLVKRIESLEAEVICEERRFGELWEQFAALDKVNQELLAALKEIVDQHGKFEHCMWAAHIAREAIAKAEVQA